MKSNSTYYKTQLFILAGLLLLSINTLSQARLTPVQSVSEGYNYIVFLPDGYNEELQDESLPVLVYLHGGQGILDGTNKFGDPNIVNAGLSAFEWGAPNLINNLVGTPRWPTYTKWPTQKFVVVIPHLPRDGSTNHNNQLWDPLKVDRVVDHVFSNFLVDDDQFYMSGISLGAKGVYDYALMNNLSHVPAAIIPISGNADPTMICRMKDIYLWALHGTDDRNVPMEESFTQPGRFGSLTLVEEYNKCNNLIKARFDTLQGVPHSNWNEYYDLTAGYDLFSWLLDHSKNKEANLAPYIGAGEDNIKILLEKNNKLTLYGYGYDSENQNSLNYNWSLISGNPSMKFLSGPDKKDVVIEFEETGEYVLNLQVSDGSKTVNDQRTVHVLEQPGNNLVLSDLQVQEGTNESPSWRTLKNGDRIDVDNPGRDRVILRSVATNGDVASVRYAMNENNNYKTLRSEQAAGGVYLHSGTSPWYPQAGEYIISATPFVEQRPPSVPGITKQFAIYVNENPPIILPVEFLEVSAARAGNNVVVKWSTASEEGNDFFTIERSPTASDHFESIGTIDGAGDSKSIKNYSFTDFVPVSGDAYYRIRQTDFDGKSDVSKIVKVKGTAVFGANLFPNPVNDGATFLKINSPDLYNPVSVHIVDAVGNRVFRQTHSPELLLKEEGYKLLMNKYLSKGIYFVIISQGENSVQKKLLVN